MTKFTSNLSFSLNAELEFEVVQLLGSIEFFSVNINQKNTGHDGSRKDAHGGSD